MNHHIIMGTLLTLLMINPIWAEDVTPYDNNNYWQCAAHDGTEKQWLAKSEYARVASGKAFEACKKESHSPSSCETTKESCEYFGGVPPAQSYGSNDHVKWQCLALDHHARTWYGPIANRDEAALLAKAYCHQHSIIPDTCYVNLITCTILEQET